MAQKQTWGDTAGGDFTFLSTDGEVLIFVVVAEPIVFAGKFKGKDQERIGIPVVTDEGFMLFITGKRLARKISKYELQFETRAFMAIRHGAEGDINATYELKLLDDTEKTKHLLELKKTEYSEEALQEAINSAAELIEK